MYNEEDGDKWVCNEIDVISDSFSDDYSDVSDESKKIDENNNVIIWEWLIICLILNKMVICKLDGIEEEIRDFKIVYFKDLNLEDIDFRDVVSEILCEILKYFEYGNVRIVRGDMFFLLCICCLLMLFLFKIFLMNVLFILFSFVNL